MNIRVGVYGCTVCTFLLVLLVRALGYVQKKEPLEDSLDLLSALYRNGKHKALYCRSEEWLVRKGAKFHFGTWLNPYSYLGIKGVLALSGFYIGKVLDVPTAVLLSVGMWELPTFLIWMLNRSDNKKMLSEMKLLYHSLEIQVKAGVHVTDAMAETYNIVQHKRLRQALLGLAGELVIEGDFYQAIDHFGKQFENEQITILCVILLQANQTGQAVELIREMEEQIKDMEGLMRMGKKQALDRAITFYQLGIFLAMLVVVLYSCITGMFQASWLF